MIVLLVSYISVVAMSFWCIIGGFIGFVNDGRGGYIWIVFFHKFFWSLCEKKLKKSPAKKKKFGAKNYTLALVLICVGVFGLNPVWKNSRNID